MPKECKLLCDSGIRQPLADDSRGRLLDEMALNRLAFAAHSKTGSEPAALQDCADGESRSFPVEICVVQQLAKTV